jgi:hypothetical protein
MPQILNICTMWFMLLGFENSYLISCVLVSHFTIFKDILQKFHIKLSIYIYIKERVEKYIIELKVIITLDNTTIKF